MSDLNECCVNTINECLRLIDVITGVPTRIPLYQAEPKIQDIISALRYVRDQ
jgi:hypothetical protein